MCSGLYRNFRPGARGCKWLRLVMSSNTWSDNTLLAHETEKYFKNFFILCGFCVVTRTKIGWQVLLAVNGSSYFAEFIILQCLCLCNATPIIRIQIYFWNFSIFYVFCQRPAEILFPGERKKKHASKNEKFGKFVETRPKKNLSAFLQLFFCNRN